MPKSFNEALSDGYIHVKDITDPEYLKQLRSEGYRIDDEGYWYFDLTQHEADEIRILPFGEHGTFVIVPMKNRIAITEPLLVRSTDE